MDRVSLFLLLLSLGLLASLCPVGNSPPRTAIERTYHFTETLSSVGAFEYTHVQEESADIVLVVEYSLLPQESVRTHRFPLKRNPDARLPWVSCGTNWCACGGNGGENGL